MSISYVYTVRVAVYNSPDTENTMCTIHAMTYPLEDVPMYCLTLKTEQFWQHSLLSLCRLEHSDTTLSACLCHCMSRSPSVALHLPLCLCPSLNDLIFVSVYVFFCVSFSLSWLYLTVSKVTSSYW